MSRLTLVRDVEEMPLSKENQDWVNDQIETAVTRRLNPTPRRAALDIIRTWGPPITIVAIFATLLGVTVASLIQAFSHVKEETEFRTKTGYRLDSIEKSLQVIRISSSAATPDSPVSQAEAKAVIAEARKNPSRPLPTPVVEQVGKSFTGAATTDPSAWKVALEFVSYRSSLNKFQVPPKGTQSLDPRSVTNYLDFGDVGPAKLEFPQPSSLCLKSFRFGNVSA